MSPTLKPRPEDFTALNLDERSKAERTAGPILALDAIFFKPSFNSAAVTFPLYRTSAERIVIKYTSSLFKSIILTRPFRRTINASSTNCRRIFKLTHKN